MAWNTQAVALSLVTDQNEKVYYYKEFQGNVLF